MSTATCRLGLVLVLATIGATLPAQTLYIDLDSIQAPESVESPLRRAVAQRNWPQAEALLFSLVQTGNPEAPLLEALATAHLLCGRYLQAATAFQRADRRRPLSAQGRYALAQAYLGLRKRHWARRELERLAQAEPKNPLYPDALAGVFQAYQWFEMAESQARRAIALRPGLAAAHTRLGEALEGRNEIPAAIQAYREALAIDREDRNRSPWPAYHLGRIVLEGGQAKEALAVLDEALEVDPRHVDATYERGMALRELGRWPEALASLERAAELRPDDARIHYALSQTYRRLGKRAEALEAIRRFRAFSPE